MAERVKALRVETSQGTAGTLHRESQFIFRYSEEALARPETAISLTMPPRPEGYVTNRLMPALAMNLPEGFLLDRVRDRYRKVLDVTDDMNLLALTSTPNSGRVWAVHSGASAPVSRMTLRQILAAKGTEHLFDQLVETFAMSSSISGVQPKVVAPLSEADVVERDRSAVERPAIKVPEFIIKAAGVEYPGLPENEFHCMSIAKTIGIPVPEFWLSDDHSLFVIKRFDILPGGGYAGFEDMASLTGRHPSKKYDGTYAIVARALRDFCSPTHGTRSVEQFFRQLVLCCLLENGDAHLKNWGVLYGNPATAALDAAISPAFDIVSTTAFIPDDTLALSLNRTKAWPDRSALETFARDHCGIPEPARMIDELLESAFSYAPQEPTEMWARIASAMERQRPRLQAAR